MCDTSVLPNTTTITHPQIDVYLIEKMNAAQALRDEILALNTRLNQLKLLEIDQRKEQERIHHIEFRYQQQQSELNELYADRVHYTSTIQTLENRYTSLSISNESALSSVTRLTNKNKELVLKSDLLAAENARLKEKTTPKDIKSFEISLSLSKDQHNADVRWIERLQQETKELKIQLECKKSEIDKLEERLTANRNERYDFINQVNQLIQESKEAKEEYAALKEQMLEKEAEIISVYSTLDSDVETINQLKMELNAVESLLKEERDQRIDRLIEEGKNEINQIAQNEIKMIEQNTTTAIHTIDVATDLLALDNSIKPKKRQRKRTYVLEEEPEEGTYWWKPKKGVKYTTKELDFMSLGEIDHMNEVRRKKSIRNEMHGV